MSSSGLPPVVVAPIILKECYGGQTAVYGAHYACEENTCKQPEAVCEVMVTDWHCACPEGQLFDTTQTACVDPKKESCAVQQQQKKGSAALEMMSAVQPCFPHCGSEMMTNTILKECYG